MSFENEEFYRKEIKELTYLLRHNEEWKDLRRLILQKGFNLNHIYLVSFFENEGDKEYGVIVTSSKKIFEYTRTTSVENKSKDYFTINEITNEFENIDKYPQINVVFKIIDNETESVNKAGEEYVRNGVISEKCPRCGGTIIYDDYKTAWVIRCEKEDCLKVTFRGL